MAIPALRGAVRTCLPTAPSTAYRVITHPQLSWLFLPRIPKTCMPSLRQQRRWNTTNGQSSPKGKTNRTAFLEGLGLGGLSAGLGTTLIVYHYLKDHPPNEKWAEFVNKIRCPVSAENYSKLQQQLEAARQRNNTLQRERDVLFAQKEYLEHERDKVPKSTSPPIEKKISKLQSDQDLKLPRFKLLKKCPSQNCKDVLKKFYNAKSEVSYTGDYIFSKSAELLAEALQMDLNPSVCSINFYGSYLLWGNLIGTILQSLINNKSIMQINIGYITRWFPLPTLAFSNADILIVVELIKKNRVLEIIVFDRNSITEKQALSLIPALKVNTTIKISMKNTGLSKKVRDQLIEASQGRIIF